jgi:predicted ATP-binding protein involved in virulence
MTKQRSKIRVDEEKALKGDMTAAFTLLQTYSDGIDANVNPDEAKKYLNICIEYLQSVEAEDCNEEPHNKITLDKLSLINFRRFSGLDVNFERDLTVFIGANGAGKTSIIDSIAKTFSWLNARIIKQGRSGKTLLAPDVRISCHDNAEVITYMRLGEKNRYDGVLARPDSGVENPTESDLDRYHELSNLYRVINDRQRKSEQAEINIPLLANYSVERSNTKSDQSFNLEKLATVDLSSRFDAIDRTATDGKINLEDFLEWFVTLDNLITSNSISGLQVKSTIEQKKIDQDKLENNILKLKNIVTDDVNHPLWDMLQDEQHELSNLNNQLASLHEQKSDSGNGLYHLQLKENIVSAIISAVPELSDMFVDKSSGRAEVKVIHNDIAINVLHLSKGQQVLLSLIADISRRLTMLNPSLINPLNGQGVVLIDEIELHLHPEWQQIVVSTLLSTFPNIQFIISTHSPQVLSTVDKRCVRYFAGDDEFGNTLVKVPDFQTKGVKSGNILANVMDVDPVPRYLGEVKMLEHFSEHLSNNDKSSAVQLLEHIVKHFGETHPVVNDCNSQIKVFEMKERISRNKKGGAS